ncbi:MAG: ribose-phosphate diphosphokinase, partial [Gaiellaceae bacterium]
MESPTATELALPGLEARVVTDPSPQHFIERGPLKRLMVFAGRSHPDLAQNIAEKLGVELGDVELETFENGETYCRYKESIRGADVFIVQTGVERVDNYLMELLFMIQAAKLASAKRITAVVPLFPYARQDRKAKPREPISARLVADMIQLAGADRVLTMDLHAAQIQGFFNIPVDNLYAMPVLIQYLRKRLEGRRVSVVSPDAGGVERARAFARRLNANLAIIDKRRPRASEVAEMQLVGEVRDSSALLVDDMIDTAGTITEAAKVVMKAG